MKLPRITSVLLGFVAAALFAGSASAQEAFTRKPVNMRAGPDRNYPLVVWLPGGATVYVNGCLSDYRWCDVTAGPNRGWIYAGNLEYSYQGRPVTIYGNGQTLALPVISFILGSYWNDYYRDRPWYGGYNQWNNWRPGTRPPVWRPQPPRPPIVRPQPPRPIPMPKPREQAPVNPPNGSLR